MRGTGRTAALCCAVALLGGCGTSANLTRGAREGWANARIYGGVRTDLKSAEDFVASNWTTKANPDLQQDVGTVVGVGLIGLDVPFSAIGDTLTLPITIPAAIWGRSAPGSGRDAAGGTGAPAGPPPSGPAGAPVPPNAPGASPPGL